MAFPCHASGNLNREVDMHESLNTACGQEIDGELAMHGLWVSAGVAMHDTPPTMYRWWDPSHQGLSNLAARDRWEAPRRPCLCICQSGLHATPKASMVWVCECLVCGLCVHGSFELTMWLGLHGCSQWWTHLGLKAPSHPTKRAPRSFWNFKI